MLVFTSLGFWIADRITEVLLPRSILDYILSSSLICLSFSSNFLLRARMSGWYSNSLLISLIIFWLSRIFSSYSLSNSSRFSACSFLDSLLTMYSFWYFFSMSIYFFKLFTVPSLEVDYFTNFLYCFSFSRLILRFSSLDFLISKY